MKYKRINCYECQYLYITWDSKHPRGCKAYGFKTRMLPSAQILRTTGTHCLIFKKKKKKRS